ncbi:MAG: nucleotidyltransferase [Agitococcus sp.]|nr:nucleotidyltransferase [Agitococcus sp.]
MTNQIVLSKRINDLLTARHETMQWAEFIARILHKLELNPTEKARAKTKYDQLAHQVAKKLDIADNDVHVIVQGSMRTQTTISPRGNTKFDLDIVVKITGSKYQNIDSDIFFDDFGQSLRGLNESSGDPIPKRRCWRLQYPGESFYFDVTPALPGSKIITGTDLRVRDPETEWSPSNPEEFADWFCTIAEKRFVFPHAQTLLKAEARQRIDPLPDEKIGLDDVLRRAVQLIKLHRDNFYFGATDKQKESQPISVILVTLITTAYNDLWNTHSQSMSSPIQLLLEVVDRMPRYISTTYGFRVENPMHRQENFADRWNQDQGLRFTEFNRWHNRLKDDLAAMFEEEYNKRSEQRIRGVFGQAGVDSWKASQPPQATNIFGGLLASQPTSGPQLNPTSPIKTGSRNTLA